MWTTRVQVLWFVLASLISFKQCLDLNLCYKNHVLRSQSANMTLGGLFPVHILRTSEGRAVKDLNYYGLSWTEAMLFAIDEINNSSSILGNYSLGFDIRDSCNSVNNALNIALDFILEDNTKRNNNVSCTCGQQTSGISAVIGGAASPISTKVSHVLSVSNIPQISYSSTSVLLSNKVTYRSFLRTIPSDTYQAKSIADLLAEFNWTYVSVVASDSEYGRAGIGALKTELKRRDICMALEIIFHPNLYAEELTKIITLLKKQVRANVVVLWCQRPIAIGFLQQATKLGLRGKTWIGTETWGDSYLLYDLSPEIVGGMLGVVPQLKKHEPFEEYLNRLNPGNSARNPWFNEYWQKEFDCLTFNMNTSPSDVNTTTKLYTNDNFFFYKPNTDGNVTIVCPRDKGFPSASRLPRNKCTNVMDAVYAVARSVTAILNCTEGKGLLANGKCPSINTALQPADLLKYVLNVSFVGRSGKTISFDKNGDLMHGAYTIKSLQPANVNSTQMKFVEFGSWDGINEKWEFISGRELLWNGWVKEIPSSQCNDLCYPGEYAVNGSTKCCWTCVKCPKDFIKRSRGIGLCTPCPEGHESNSNRTVCNKRVDDYLDWWSGQALSVMVVSILGILHGVSILAVFIRYRSTAVVKASNRELSLIHLSFLVANFAFSLFLIGKPTPVRCGVRSFLFSILFTVSTSITLLKTDRLLRIFRSRSRLSAQSRLLTNKMQLMTAAGLTSLPLLIALMWVIIRPPAIIEIDTDMHHRVIHCSADADSLQMIVLSYVLLLALVSTYFAYRARQLPENFNEAKFIGFAMFSFCVFWLSFVPAFYSSTGANRDFVHCLTVIFSTLSVTCIMYYPKVRIILFFPDQNKTEVFRINASTINIRNQLQTQSNSPPRLSPMPSPLEPRKDDNSLQLPVSPQISSGRMSALAVGGDIVYS